MSTGIILQYVAIAIIAIGVVLFIFRKTRKMSKNASDDPFCTNCSLKESCKKAAKQKAKKHQQ